MKNAFPKTLLAAATIATLPAAALSGDVPTVSNVRIEPQGSKIVTVTYALSEAPAVVTAEIFTNGVSVGDAAAAFMEGDVNRYVANDGATKAIHFRPADFLPEDTTFPDCTIRVKAWNVEDPPDYMVVGLGEPSTVRYYVSTNALPFGGLADDWYRTNAIVLKRIHAAGVRWGMGAPSREVEQEGEPKPHRVTLTGDYYMGVFEVTQAQQLRVHGTRGVRNSSGDYDAASETTAEDADLRPVHARRTELRPYATFDAVTNRVFAGDWIVSSFRSRTGIDFDLPTEAQWEYACRAGSKWSLHIGDLGILPVSSDYARATQYAILDRCAWHTRNSDGHTHRVGSLEPNEWGLYDLHGNIAEGVLDFFNAYDLDAELDPPGNAVAQMNGDTPWIICRGGYYRYDYYQYLIKDHSRMKASAWKSDECGYRLVAPARATAAGSL